MTKMLTVSMRDLSAEVLVYTFESAAMLSVAALEPGQHKHRYVQQGDEWGMRTWQPGQESYCSGLLAQRPPWLVEIINMAIVGEHAMYPPDPPGSMLVWFMTDAGMNLLNIEPNWKNNHA